MRGSMISARASICGLLLVWVACKAQTPHSKSSEPAGPGMFQPTRVLAAGDQDGDGIPNADDKCPDDHEICNGRDDEDGCPEESKFDGYTEEECGLFANPQCRRDFRICKMSTAPRFPGHGYCVRQDSGCACRSERPFGCASTPLPQPSTGDGCQLVDGCVRVFPKYPAMPGLAEQMQRDGLSVVELEDSVEVRGPSDLLSAGVV